MSPDLPASPLREGIAAGDIFRPRVLLVGRTRYRFPLSPSLSPKFDALRRTLDLRVLASAAPTWAGAPDWFELIPPFRPRALDGIAFYLRLPFRVARQVRRFDPDAVIAQSPYEAAAVLLARMPLRTKTPVIVEVHGDWRTATRMYGSTRRRFVSPLGDAVSRYGVRHADAVRTVSPYTTALVEAEGVTPSGSFPAYMDLLPFLDRPPTPLPERPVALFIGVLETYKNIDGLADAWRRAAPRVPDARLVIVGSGSRADVVEALVAELPEQTIWHRRLDAPAVSRALDDATILVLPSRSEGLGRVIIESLCRGRPVIGSRVGGIADLLADGVNGVLVEPGDVVALADGLVRVLSDSVLVERLTRVARSSVEEWLLTPAEYAGRTRELVERVSRRPAR